MRPCGDEKGKAESRPIRPVLVVFSLLFLDYQLAPDAADAGDPRAGGLPPATAISLTATNERGGASGPTRVRPNPAPSIASGPVRPQASLVPSRRAFSRAMSSMSLGRPAIILELEQPLVTDERRGQAWGQLHHRGFRECLVEIEGASTNRSTSVMGCVGLSRENTVKCFSLTHCARLCASAKSSRGTGVREADSLDRPGRPQHGVGYHPEDRGSDPGRQ